MAISSNQDSIPSILLRPGLSGSQAVYIDVNPAAGGENPVLLYNAAAVFASLRNLFMCVQGSRGRIFQEDYFSGVYELLQEPLDDVTASSLSIAIFQAVRKWEPRVTIRSSDIVVVTNYGLPGYEVTVTLTINGVVSKETYDLISNA